MKKLNLTEEVIRILEDESSEQKELNDEDLRDMLREARRILKELVGVKYIQENDDGCPIHFKKLGISRLGLYQESFLYGEIFINELLKTESRENVMPTVIHEYLHSLFSCRSCGHKGEWLRLANLINNKTEYNITRLTKIPDTYRNTYNNTKNIIYHVICNHCGAETTRYKNIGVVKNPENYYHECPDGTKGKFRIEPEYR